MSASGEKMTALHVGSRFIDVVIEDLVNPDRRRVAIIPMEVPYMAGGNVPTRMRIGLAFTITDARIGFIQGAPFLLYDGEDIPVMHEWHGSGCSRDAVPVFLHVEGQDIIISAITRAGQGIGRNIAPQVRWVIQTPNVAYPPEHYLRNNLVEFSISDLRKMLEAFVEIHSRARPDAHRLNGHPALSVYYKAELTAEEIKADSDLRQMIGGSEHYPLPMPAVYRVALLGARKIHLMAYPHSTVVVLADKSCEHGYVAPLLRLVEAPPLDALEAVEVYVTTTGTCFLFMYYDAVDEKHVKAISKRELASLGRDLVTTISRTIGQMRQLTRITQRAMSTVEFAAALTRQRTITEYAGGGGRAETADTRAEARPAEVKTAAKPETRHAEPSESEQPVFEENKM